MAFKKIIKRILIILIPILIIVASVMTAYKMYLYFNKSIYEAISDENEAIAVQISIPKGTTTEQIGEILYNNGLIKNKTTFRIYLKISKLSGNLKAGDYEFNTAMSPVNMIEKMINGDTIKDTFKLVIPEGYSVLDIAVKLENLNIVKKDDFIKTVNEANFNYSFLKDLPNRNYRLEGYLFPDTYEFFNNVTSEQIIKKMLDRFNQIFTEDMKKRAADLNMSIDQIVTAASIIEKEARVAEERPIMAAVYYNRIKIKMPLQADATVLYALGGWKETVLYKDLEIDSAYNTYKYQGLPIGPISNPGKASIEAALNPAKVNYLYYVLKNANTSEHYFTNSYDDFLNAKQKYINSKK